MKLPVGSRVRIKKYSSYAYQNSGPGTVVANRSNEWVRVRFDKKECVLEDAYPSQELELVQTNLEIFEEVEGL